MEVREIAGDVFISVGDGRREELATPSNAKAAARQAIATFEIELRDLSRQADELRYQIGQAAVLDEPTGELRAKLAAVTSAIESACSTISTQRRRIADIDAALDRHRAERLQREHADHLAALIAPFERLLQEIRT
jgi:septal ring factor EnvC (AmiA/AmiB activator)